MSGGARHARSGNSSLAYLALGVVAGLVLMTGAYRLFLTVPITLEGESARVGAGTRVSDLIAGERVGGIPGNLVSVKTRRVLTTGAGEPPFVSVNGRHAQAADRLFASDVVAGMNGTDTVEPLAKRLERIAPPVIYRGSGPFESIVGTGVAGVKEVTFGTISKEVAATRVVKPAEARVIQRTAPPPGAKLAALTFDDGPWPGTTKRILAILQRYNVKASFFMIGSQARGRPEIAKAVADAGHLVCNHTESHPNLQRLSAAAVTREIEIAQRDITAATGRSPRYFRPPGGSSTRSSVPVLRRYGLKSVMWTVDPMDWRRPSAKTIADRVVGETRPGAVILLHDGGGDRSRTVGALPGIIERLRAKGYIFVTLDAISSLPRL